MQEEVKRLQQELQNAPEANPNLQVTQAVPPAAEDTFLVPPPEEPSAHAAMPVDTAIAGDDRTPEVMHARINNAVLHSAADNELDSQMTPPALPAAYFDASEELDPVLLLDEMRAIEAEIGYKLVQAKSARSMHTRG